MAHLGRIGGQNFFIFVLVNSPEETFILCKHRFGWCLCSELYIISDVALFYVLQVLKHTCDSLHYLPLRFRK